MVIQKTKNEIHKVLCNNCDLFIYLFFQENMFMKGKIVCLRNSIYGIRVIKPDVLVIDFNM